MKDIQDPIELNILWLEVRKTIANAMRTLGKNGFEICGHGFGIVGEDFELCNFKKNRSVNICDKNGRKIVVTIRTSSYPQDKLFEGSVRKSLEFLGITNCT